jgi:hypothetical protein
MNEQEQVRSEIRMLQEHARDCNIPLPEVPETNDAGLLAVYRDEIRFIIEGGAE